MSKEDKKKVVILGGGHGGSVVLSSLKDYDIDLTAIVSMADNGGSTGRLRQQLGVSPPGDIRQYIVAGSNSTELKDFFSYRFERGDLKGHSFGNIFLSAGEAMTGSLEQSINIARKALDCKPKILPVTEDKIELILTQATGEVVKGEDAILQTRLDSRQPELHLEPKGELTDSSRQEIEKADLIVIAPGNFYCSIIPTLIVDGMADALKASQAKVLFICNLINLPHHTQGFSITEYVDEINRCTDGVEIDYVLCNDGQVSAEFMRDGEEPVVINRPELDAKPYRTIELDITGTDKIIADKNDVISHTRSLLAHDKQKLGTQIVELVNGL